MRQKYKGKDIIDRLNNTVIRYKSIPYLCTVSSDLIICLHDLSNGNLAYKTNSDDEDLDISSINIGYVNISNPDYKLAVYLKREPVRRYKQGITLETLTQKPLRTGVSSVSVSLLHSRDFVDAVMGRFPSFKEAMKMITKSGWHSVALSRDIALRREVDMLKVHLKEDEVGFIRLGTDNVIVPKTDMSYYHAFLLESMKDWKVTEGF